MAIFPIEIMVKLTYYRKRGDQMAEYCFDCWKKINRKKYLPRYYRLSRTLEKCEGCGKWKRVVEEDDFYDYHPRVRDVILMYEIIVEIIFFFWRMIQKRWKNDKDR